MLKSSFMETMETPRTKDTQRENKAGGSGVGGGDKCKDIKINH